MRLFPAKKHQPIGSSRMTFCTASWGALKPSSSIRCLVLSAALPIRAWMGWPLVIEYFVFLHVLDPLPLVSYPSWQVREALALPLASRIDLLRSLAAPKRQDCTNPGNQDRDRLNRCD